MKLFHLLVAGEPLAALGLSGITLLRRAWYRSVLADRARIAIGGGRQRNGGECLVVALQDSLRGFAQVLQEMPAIQDLHDSGSALLDAALVLGGAV